MYTRSYGGDKTDLPIPPDRYDGIAISEELSAQNRDTGATLTDFSPPDEGAVDRRVETKNPWEREAVETSSAANDSDESVTASVGARESGLFSGIPFLSGLFGGGSIPFLSSVKMPKIGIEEILIIGAALLMFFSKNGDKECAIILTLLLFIN